MQKVTHRLPGSRSAVETAPLPMTKQDYVVKHSYHLAILLCILQTIALVYVARDGLKSFNVNEGFRWCLAAFFTATSAIAVVFKKGNYLIPTIFGYCAIIIFFLLGALYFFLVALFPELLLSLFTASYSTGCLIHTLQTSHDFTNLMKKRRFDCFMNSIIGCISCLVAAVLTSWPLMVNMLAIHQMEVERKKKKANLVILASPESSLA